MVTKAELTETINELTEKFNYIAQELESLWQEANAKGLHDFADRVERVQFSNYANPSDFTEKHHFKELFKVVEENEKAKHLDKLLEYERIVNRVISLGESAKKIKHYDED